MGSSAIRPIRPIRPIMRIAEFGAVGLDFFEGLDILGDQLRGFAVVSGRKMCFPLL